MALTRSLVRASVSRDLAPADAIAAADDLIASESSLGFFVTLFYAVLNVSDGQMVYVNAGHNPPLLYSARDGALQDLALTGIPLGIQSHSSYEQKRLCLQAGDSILLYTDGVLDANDPEGQFFGRERLMARFLGHRRSSAKEALQAVERALDEFTAGSPQYDDITLLLVKRDELVGQPTG